MGELKIGRGTEENVKVGPLTRPTLAREGRGAGRRRAEKGRQACSSAGSRRTAPAISTSPPSSATWVPTPACSARRFGYSVAPVAFRVEEDAIAAANDTEYGLVAYVFTRDFLAGPSA